MNSCIATVNQNNKNTPESPRYFNQPDKLLNNNFGINSNSSETNIGSTFEQNNGELQKKNLINVNSAVNIKEDYNYVNNFQSNKNSSSNTNLTKAATHAPKENLKFNKIQGQQGNLINILKKSGIKLKKKKKVTEQNSHTKQKNDTRDSEKTSNRDVKIQLSKEKDIQNMENSITTTGPTTISTNMNTISTQNCVKSGQINVKPIKRNNVDNSGNVYLNHISSKKALQSSNDKKLVLDYSKTSKNNDLNLDRVESRFFDKNREASPLYYIPVDSSKTNFGSKDGSTSRGKISTKLIKQTKPKNIAQNSSNRDSASPKYKKLGIFNNLKINTKIRDQCQNNAIQVNSFSKSPTVENSGGSSNINYNINFLNTPNIMTYLKEGNTVKTQNITQQFNNKANSPIKG